MPPDSAPRRASNLLNQSHEGLEKDLNVHAGDGLPSWKMQKNVQANDAHDEQSIRACRVHSGLYPAAMK
jgi:hypothetical protein